MPAKNCHSCGEDVLRFCRFFCYNRIIYVYILTYNNDFNMFKDDVEQNSEEKYLECYGCRSNPCKNVLKGSFNWVTQIPTQIF